VLAKQSETDFVGYSIPHPSEHLFQMRLQTTKKSTVTQALNKSLQLMCDMCDVLEDTLNKAEKCAIESRLKQTTNDNDVRMEVQD